MLNIPESISSLSANQGFYRSAQYDQAWMFDNSMGLIFTGSCSRMTGLPEGGN
jgi:hypothetical protein